MISYDPLKLYKKKCVCKKVTTMLVGNENCYDKNDRTDNLKITVIKALHAYWNFSEYKIRHQLI